MDILRYLAGWTFVLAENEKFVDAEKKKAKLFYAENETLNKKSRLFQKKQSAFLLQKFQKEGKKMQFNLGMHKRRFMSAIKPTKRRDQWHLRLQKRCEIGVVFVW